MLRRSVLKRLHEVRFRFTVHSDYLRLVEILKLLEERNTISFLSSYIEQIKIFACTYSIETVIMVMADNE